MTQSVTPQGEGSFTVQWRRDGLPLPGETARWIEFPGFSEDALGDCDVGIIGPDLASINSSAATQTLSESTLDPYEQWPLTHGLTADDGDFDDCDLDGLTNLIGFSLGTALKPTTIMCSSLTAAATGRQSSPPLPGLASRQSSPGGVTTANQEA